MNYFIMMNSQHGNYILPLVVENGDDVALFDTLEEAQACAKDHHFCNMFGYEIFERGTGEQ